MSGSALGKLPILLSLVFFWLSCAAPCSADNTLAPQSLAQSPLAGNRAGWTTADFVDLVKRAKSECVVESAILVRCAGPLRLAGLARTWVRGNGVRVEFLDPLPGKGGVVLTGARDVVLSGIEIGWLGGGARDPTPPGGQRIQSFGDVTACTHREAGGVLALDQPMEGMAPLGAVSVWDDAVGWPWYRSAPDAFEVYFPRDAAAAFSAGRSDCLPQLARLVGRRVLVRHFVYANHAFTCSGCRNVTIDKFRVTSAPGMAFVFGGGGSNLNLRGNVVEPRCSPRCDRPEPSVASDGAHFAGIEGNILVEGNDFGWQGDDSVNITGLLIPVRPEPEMAGTGAWLRVDEQWRGRFSTLAAGSKVLLFDHGLNALGEAEILDVAPSTLRLILSQLPSTAGGLLIARADNVPRKVAIRNNRFHDHRARGILMGASDAVIENNDIERVTMEAILVSADTGPWYEGPGSQHVAIKGNRISNVNRYPAVPDYPSAISIGASLGAGYVGKVCSPLAKPYQFEVEFSPRKEALHEEIEIQ